MRTAVETGDGIGLVECGVDVADAHVFAELARVGARIHVCRHHAHVVVQARPGEIAHEATEVGGQSHLLFFHGAGVVDHPEYVHRGNRDLYDAIHLLFRSEVRRIVAPADIRIVVDFVLAAREQSKRNQANPAHEVSCA